MRRIAIPQKLMAGMALAACALIIFFGLTCGFAYGNSKSDGGEAESSTSLMAGWIDGPAHMVAASKSAVYNIGSGSCTCDDPDTEYTIVGTSMDGATVTIKGGNEQNPIRVTLDNVTIDQGSVSPACSPITVESGQALITLRGTNVLRAGYKDVTLWHDSGFAGLCVQKGAVCVITSADGDGSTSGLLEAHGGHNQYGGAGIGTSYDDDTGSIYILGGTIKAYGAPSAAGIGSGRDGECYTVCIQGGDVWAWGGEYAAGIGGGDAVGASTGGATHDLWIHGGTVHAYGGDNGGAGIGGSEGGSTDKITITGGNITAYGCGEHGSKGSAAGIGSGDGVECKTIEIDQDSGSVLTIDARGYGEGAGIGGANCVSGTIDIKLRGGTITATGGPEAAGIGGGDNESGTINIKGNGTINAHAGWKSTAIGAGDQAESGPININGNSSRLNINAYAPEPQNQGEGFVSYAALIGSGKGNASNISINNANISLNGTSRATIDGAGIGTGSSNDLSLKDDGIGTIAISNAQIRFNSIYKMSGAGIGAGYGSSIKAITLDNVDYEGPTIGSSCSDRFGTDENSMESISISNSNIKAIARGDSKRNHAGIGTGPYGTIDKIAIANSNIEAKGVYGGAGIGSGGIYVNPGQPLHSITSSDGKCGSLTITGPGTIKATGSDGGAGIGGGALASVYGDISISRGTTVEAVGGSDSGAGIGGGKLCSCANISIDGATVTATGGPAAAAIGSGGVSDATVVSGAIQSTWNTICGNISISGKSNVTATGGDGAAGIGLGQGAQMKSGSGITISDSTVNAKGGTRGAGIGGGRESGLGRGAEARRIRIEGESKVTSTGGAGAAGIGGGYEGGVEQCHISLSVNDPAWAFVIAHGGAGAAGIGGGASSRQSTSKGTLDGAHDAKSISISGGFVAAYGGDGSESSEEGRTGAGAGIGGGSYQGDLEGCLISGGVIIAQHGAKAIGGPTSYIDAEDIGHGGSREGGGDGSDSIYIQGGTVVGEVNENERVLVSGGSVTHRFAFDKATRSNFEYKPVYQNAIAIDTSPLVPFVFEGKSFYKLGLTVTSVDYFHGDDVFAIADGEGHAKAYLYLPAGEANATTAFVKPADATLSYYGTTFENQYPDYKTSANVLKMGAPITIVPKRRSASLIEGEPYAVRVGDLSGTLGDGDSACYTSAAYATYEGYRMADDTINKDVSHVPIYTNYANSGRTYTDVIVVPGPTGETMTLTAKLNNTSGASDLYWGNGEVVFEKAIEAAPPYVKITNKDALTRLSTDPEVYPAFQTNSRIKEIKCVGEYGTVYNGEATSPDDRTYMPKGVGYYEVTVWAESDGKTTTDSASFKIVDPEAPKEPTSLTVSDPSKVYDAQPVSPVVQCTSDGIVTSSYRKNDGTALSGPPTDAGDYILKVSVPTTVTYEAASTVSQFSITPKPASLALSASGNGSTKVATVAVRLSGAFENVIGSDVEISLDGVSMTAQLASSDNGSFTATCTFNGVEPGRHVASAHYTNPNYLVDDATTTFTVEAPPPDVEVKIVEDPTKYYDGDPVADPKVEATPGAAVTYLYRSSTNSTSSNAPKEPGVYLVTATATLNGSSASDTRLFLIRKCPVILDIDVSDKAYDAQPATVNVTANADNGKPLDEAQTIGLSYYKKQDDGSFGDKLDSAPADIGSYLVVATSSGSLHYRPAEASAAFSILDKLVPFLFVDMPERLVYDAQAVDYPIVWKYSDGEVKVTYYDENDAVLDGMPKDAGSYSVEVSVSATAKYCAVSSGKIPFTILPRPAVLSISAVGDQSTESAEVAVTIAGALEDIEGKLVDIGVMYDEPDAMSAQSVDDPRLTTQAAATVQAHIENVDGSLVATHKFPHVGAGEYKVTASYSNDPNYIVKDKAERFDKRLRGYRISAEDKTVTFGAAPFAVQAEVRNSNGSEVANPALSYSLVPNEDLPMVGDDVAVLDDGGIVSVQNAGISAIRVDVAGDDTHEGNFDYAVITVEKAPLPLTVTAKDKAADGKPAEVTYSVDDAAYPKPYSGDVTLTYFREGADVRTQLDAAPTESGSYVVVAMAAGDRNYNAAVAEASFTIGASGDPAYPDSPKIGGTSAPRTGDNIVAYPLVVLAALGLVALVFSTRRRRAK